VDALHTFQIALSTVSLVSFMVASPASAVEYINEAEYLAIGIEAEEFISKDERWVLTNANSAQGAYGADPDGNHSDTASGGVYFEVLPDIRVAHEDSFGPPTAYWGPPGVGPQMSWQITVPEAGRYYVHARAYSTGTEDNGLHVGFNDGWPKSGRQIQFCTSGRRAWSWSSAQRDSGGVGSCGIQKTIYLDFETAGTHTLSVSAREDGFELDRLVLIKDKSGNTKTCSPTTATGITCRDGGIESADEQTDVAVSVETLPEGIATGDDKVSHNTSFSMVVAVENDDRFDAADDITVGIEFAEGLTVSTVPVDCLLAGQTVSCSIDVLEPTAPGEAEKYTFEVSVVDADTSLRPISVSAESATFDGRIENNSASFNVVISPDDLRTDVAAEVAVARDNGADAEMPWVVGETGTLFITLSNTSQRNATLVNVAVQLGEGVTVDVLPEQCVGTLSVNCALELLTAGDTKTIGIDIRATAAGTQVIDVLASTANDTDASNNSDSTVVVLHNKKSDSASLAWQTLLGLLLFTSASVYWRHQRQLITVRKRLRRE